MGRRAQTRYREDAMSVETIILEGHLSSRDLIDRLAPVGQRLRLSGDPVSLLFDAAALDSYEVDAVVAFIIWHERHRDAIRKVAVVIDPRDRSLQQMAKAIGLTAKASMKAWDSYDQAFDWAAA
jgi:hypothetical protein